MEKENILKIKILPNGPLSIGGKVELTLADGSKVEKNNPSLCRCGASKNKPSCDGTHMKIGFKG